ncbi:MAG TPA: SpoIIE family protein phosphatase [Candidatus Competibacteraceae bacterium]|nr:SpoIIE family protein phosphatase [Candidatus Competibacteraceae bacterium]HPF59022.1 SpoIIE family protein phosphatase [Candidatus Competibacteraceae bacterium]HRY19353.1 SpoIIE family protein phosphatase [Candidatus Competibacteraceae bacterium]
MSIESKQRSAGNTPAGVPAYSPMHVRLGLAARLSLTLVGAVALVFVTAFYYDYQKSHQHMLDSVNAVIAGLSGAIIGNVQGILADVMEVASKLTQSLEQGADIEALRAVATDAVMDSSYCNAVTIVLDSRSSATPLQSQAQMLNCRYSHSKVDCDLTGVSAHLEPMIQDSFSKPLKQGIWSEPFLNPDAGNAVSAYTLPVYGMQNGVQVAAGTVSAELSLSSLMSAIERLRVFQTGYVFILSGDGRYLAHLDPQRVLSETIFDVARFQKNPNLFDIGQRMIRGETGFAALWSPYLHKPARIYFTPLPGTNWSIGVVFGEEELFANLETLAGEVYLIGGIGLLLLLALVILIVRRFTRPLLVLTEKSVAIAGGDLDVAIPAPRAFDEVGVLTQSFLEMRQALRQQLDTLAEARAAQARIDNELKIARGIQDSFLPRNPAELAAQGGLEVATWFQPAREVGGDLFQCFWLADGRLFLGIGDVAGKSVPAALMMAVTTTLVKAMAATTPDPAGVLEQVNRELCVLNERLLFVTFFAAALHPETGKLTFGNAGHNPPLIRHADGSAEFMDIAAGLVLGVEPNWTYTPVALCLAPGDILLLYTDGVTEAMNAAGECFDPRRLLEVSREPEIASPHQLIERVIAAVTAHAGLAEQSDDLTLLAVAHPGAAAKSTVRSPTP